MARLRIKKVKKSIIDFANQVNGEKHWEGKQYQEKKNGIIENQESRSRGIVTFVYIGG